MEQEFWRVVKRNGWKEIWGRKYRAPLTWEVGSGQMVSVSLHVRSEWLSGIHRPWGSD